MNTMRTLTHECLRIPWCEKGHQSDNFLWLLPVLVALCGKLHLVSPNCVNVPMLTQPVPFQAPTLTNHPICHQHPPPLFTKTTLPTRGETPVHLAPHIHVVFPRHSQALLLEIVAYFCLPAIHKDSQKAVAKQNERMAVVREAEYPSIKPLLRLLLSFFTYHLETKAYCNFMRITPNGLNLISTGLNNVCHAECTQYLDPTQSSLGRIFGCFLSSSGFVRNAWCLNSHMSAFYG